LQDRNVNWTRIVLAREIARVGQNSVKGGPRPTSESHSRVVPELKPVETEPLHLQTAGGASQVDEAGTTDMEGAGKEAHG